MFKKPRRHFRQRKDTDNSDEDQDTGVIKPQKVNTEDASSNGKTKRLKTKTTQGPVTAPTVLALQHDHDDDIEEFKVRKTKQSRKLAKQLKSDRRKEKNEKENHTGDDIEVEITLNGDRALDMDLDSDYEGKEEEEEDEKPAHAFKSVLERGEIPDANLIHMARKKRMMAREQGDQIPLDEDNKVEQAPSSTQRLIREEDHDISDDEGRMEMSLNSAARDRQQIKDTFLAAEHGSDSDGEHDLAWEEQQIRKVVGKGELPAQVDQEMGYYNMGHHEVGGLNYDMAAAEDALKPLPDTISVDVIRKQLKTRLDSLQQVHRVHCQEKENIISGLAKSVACAEELENRSSDSMISRLNAKYQFYQEIRSYVRDLLDCFNEKFTAISDLDTSMMKIIKTRCEKLCKRRQEDIRDENSDCASINKSIPITGNETTAEIRLRAIKQRRVADREARRSRRRRIRVDAEVRGHHEGLSSDEEESKSDTLKYQSDKEKIIGEANTLFEDVIEDFSTVPPILAKFDEWKQRYRQEYNDAYIGLCLPKLLTPVIKLSLIDWNPLEENSRTLSEMLWFRSVILYGHTNTFDSDDVDCQLLPLIVEKVLIPKITGYIEMAWDPMSTSHTERLAATLHEYIDTYPTLTAQSKMMNSLLQALSDRFTLSLDEDTFMPLFSADLLAKSTDARGFLHRQIWSSIKLYRNILRFSLILSDARLRSLALDSLLNRYVMLGLQCAGPDDAVEKIKAVTSALPHHWLIGESDTCLPQLENLCRFIKSCLSTYHQQANASSSSRNQHRDNMKALLKILVDIHALDHAKFASDEYSLRMPK